MESIDANYIDLHFGTYQWDQGNQILPGDSVLSGRVPLPGSATWGDMDYDTRIDEEIRAVEGSRGAEGQEESHYNNNYITSSESEGTSRDKMVVTEGSVDNGRPRGKKLTVSEKDEILLSKDDSELSEEDLQEKRKAQNRAAQRAFRKRKETKIKSLLEELQQSQKEKQRLMVEMGLYKQENEFIRSQMVALRKQKTSPRQNLVFDSHVESNRFLENLLKESLDKQGSDTNLVKKAYLSPDSPNDNLLTVTAVWDYIHLRIEETGCNIDVSDVMLKLKGNEKCHGFGPAYSADLVNKVINECSNKN